MPQNPAEDSESSKDQHQLPFHDGDAGQPTGSDAANQGQAISNAPANGDLPFTAASTVSLAAGTLLTVRLEDGLSSAKSASAKSKFESKSDASFTAVLEEPVVVNGNTVVAHGTVVRGRVEAARSSSSLGANQAFVRLTLVSIRVDGRDLAVQTSSLFARGRAGLAAAPVHAVFSAKKDVSRNDTSSAVQIQKGRLLTFRLSSSVSVPAMDTARLTKNVLPASAGPPANGSR
jgi:hypothetical protein